MTNDALVIDCNGHILDHERINRRIVDCGDSDIIYTNLRRTPEAPPDHRRRSACRRAAAADPGAIASAPVAVPRADAARACGIVGGGPKERHP